MDRRGRAYITLLASLALVLGYSLACVTGPSPKELKQAEIEYDLGLNDLRAGRLKEALRSFLDSVELNPDFHQVHNALGLTYYMLGDNKKAIASFDKALELKPDYSEVLNNKARIYIDEGRFRKAIPLLQKALEDVFLTERYLAESNLGWALFHIGEEEEGFKHVKNAIAQNDKYCVGYQYLGLMFQKKKEFDKAIEQFKKVLKLCPTYPQGNRDLGKTLLMAGKATAGCKALKKCLENSGMSEIGQECQRLFELSCTGLDIEDKNENSGG